MFIVTHDKMRLFNLNLVSDICCSRPVVLKTPDGTESNFVGADVFININGNNVSLFHCQMAFNETNRKNQFELCAKAVGRLNAGIISAVAEGLEKDAKVVYLPSPADIVKD